MYKDFIFCHRGTLPSSILTSAWVSKALIAPRNGAREEVGPAVGGGPLVPRIWGPTATTGMLVVAASRLGALSSDNGGVGSI